jgi:hypothetical protein
MLLFYGSLGVGIIANKSSGFGLNCFLQEFFEMLSCGTLMAVVVTGEVRELMKDCNQALFQPEMAEDLSKAMLS